MSHLLTTKTQVLRAVFEQVLSLVAIFTIGSFVLLIWAVNNNMAHFMTIFAFILRAVFVLVILETTTFTFRWASILGCIGNPSFLSFICCCESIGFLRG